MSGKREPAVGWNSESEPAVGLNTGREPATGLNWVREPTVRLNGDIEQFSSPRLKWDVAVLSCARRVDTNLTERQPSASGEQGCGRGVAAVAKWTGIWPCCHRIDKELPERLPSASSKDGFRRASTEPVKSDGFRRVLTEPVE